jgi:hypothetical protein
MRGLSPKNRRAGLFACLCVAVLLLLFGWFLTTAAKKCNSKKPKKDVSGACPAKTGDPGALSYIESTSAAARATRPYRLASGFWLAKLTAGTWARAFGPMGAIVRRRIDEEQVVELGQIDAILTGK